MKNIVGLLAFSITTILTMTGCATIVNDANIPLAVSFSDGSAGRCNFRNKRGAWSSEIPTSNVLIRRSDDALVYDCTTSDGREVTGSIKSEVEGGKMAASVIFWDFGITDSITDKHRTYQGNVAIPVPANAQFGATPKTDIPKSNGAVSQPRAVSASKKNDCEFIKTISAGAGGGSGNVSSFVEKAMESALRQVADIGADSYFVVSADSTATGSSVILEALKCN